MTATGSVATIQMEFAWLDTASVLRGRFAEKLLALGGLPTALGSDCLMALGQDTSNLTNM